MMNTHKRCLLPFPDFDPVAFPYVATSGREGIDVLNVNNYSYAHFIGLPAKYLCA